MTENLVHLITEYQTSVRIAVALMHRSGIPMPFSSWAWIEADIPPRGVLDDGVEYIKHGAGCKVRLDSGEVDFDFGKDGEIDGFDIWRLIRFAKLRLLDYGFESKDVVEQDFNAAITSEELEYSGSCLYYLAGTARSLAIDIDCRLPGDTLPSQNQDPILLLYTHYFLAAELMLKNYEKLNRKWSSTGKLSRNDEVQIRIYFFSWLGFLGVTCEGYRNFNMRHLLAHARPDSFKEIIPLSDALGKNINTHWHPLREFRNDVFHLRKNHEKIRNFFSRDSNRFSWARELHKAMENFFSEYRSSCELHYFLHNRKGEIDIGRSRERRRFSP